MTDTIPSETEDILHLLVNAVLADEVVRDEEVIALSEAAIALELKDASGAPLEKTWVQSWVRDNYRALFDIYGFQDQDTDLINLIMRMQGRHDKGRILGALTQICHADAEYHKNEKMLISLISAYWS